MQRPPRLCPRPLGGEIAEGKDADEALLTVHHWQASHLNVGHVLRDMIEILVFEAVLDFLRHNLVHLRVGPLALADTAYCDVTVGDHADQTILLPDRERADIFLEHQLRGFTDGLSGADDANVAGHYVCDFHDDSPAGS